MKWVVRRHAEGSELQVVYLVVGVVEQRHLESIVFGKFSEVHYGASTQSQYLFCFLLELGCTIHSCSISPTAVGNGKIGAP